MPLSEYVHIQVRYVEGVAVVSFPESTPMLEGEKVEPVGAELADLAASRKEPRIVLNLSGTRFLSSAMLAHLVRLQRQVQSSKGRLRLCGLRPTILDAFKSANFHKIFDIVPDEAAALKKF